jgi:hypothetical protein
MKKSTQIVVDEHVQKYKDAVWDFVFEHCDVTNGGSLFVKFHTPHRKNFEKRVYARLNGYHREDVKKKKFKAQTLKQEEMDKKIAKLEKYNERKKRIKKYKKLPFFMKWYYKRKYNINL